MKKKTGFTLIELLAVIIILAIIALIATPIVLNVVEESKETARKNSISGYASGVRYAVYDSGYALTGKYPEVNKEWAEANVETSGDTVNCEEIGYSETYETVLHKCKVGKSDKEYCFAGGKTYEDCEDAEYKNIHDSLGNIAVSGSPLVEELLKQYNESNTVGLLKDDTGYYYKGTKEEVSNNFVWFAGHLWRVISIDNDNNLTMITQQPLTAIHPASSVWTTKEEYEGSYINHWLNNETDGVFYKSLTQDDKDKIKESNFNIGEIQVAQKVGLLAPEIYMKAFSFLYIQDGFWLGYPNGDIASATDEGYIASGIDFAKNSYGVRPVIKISDLAITDGEGTLTNPFRKKSTTTNIADIKVGEYISIPTSGTDCGEDNRCLFRVVSKDDNSIKVILNGLLPNTSKFGSSSTYISGNTIDMELARFSNTISTKYRYTKNKTFNVGTYDNGINYIELRNNKYTGTEENPVNVGLPIIGEMFSGNDIDLSTTTEKTFVNASTIENPAIASTFWTMTAIDYDNMGVYTISADGNVNALAGYVNFSNGVRPVLFLNNNLNFTSGEGTAENPFMLGE